MTEAAADWKARPEGPEYDEMRQRLIDAAEAIVRDRGVSGLRFDSVGEVVGLHRSSVYRYFDSKEELLTAVVVQATLRVGRAIIEQLGQDARPEQYLVEGLAMSLAVMANDPVHRSLMDPSASASMARVGGRALTEGIRPLVEPMFNAAAASGALRPDVTPDEGLRWLQIVATGLVRAPDVVPDLEELSDLLRRVLVPALFVTPLPG